MTSPEHLATLKPLVRATRAPRGEWLPAGEVARARKDFDAGTHTLATAVVRDPASGEIVTEALIALPLTAPPPKLKGYRFIDLRYHEAYPGEYHF